MCIFVIVLKKYNLIVFAFDYNLGFSCQWSVYFDFFKVVFSGVVYSLGLAQTVESQHKKESRWYFISVRPSVLPAEVNWTRLVETLFLLLFFFCYTKFKYQRKSFFLGIFTCKSCGLFLFYCHDAEIVRTDHLIFKLCPQPVWPPCGEASEETPVPDLQQVVPHHQ